MLIYGFGHRRGVGKDAFAHLVAHHLKELRPKLIVTQTAFADKLYEICHSLYHWAGFETRSFYCSRPELKEMVLPAIGKSPREILIDFGTKAVRKKVYDQTWIKYLINNNICGHITLIADMRFPNEAEAIKEAGGAVYRIDRPGIKKYKDVADMALAKYNGWNGVILNDGHLGDLSAMAHNFARRILKSCKI